MRESRAYDADLHAPGSTAVEGGCSHHDREGADGCTGTAVVSFRDEQGVWQSGCSGALEQLVADGSIEPFGQGA